MLACLHRTLNWNPTNKIVVENLNCRFLVIILVLVVFGVDVIVWIDYICDLIV